MVERIIEQAPGTLYIAPMGTSKPEMIVRNSEFADDWDLVWLWIAKTTAGPVMEYNYDAVDQYTWTFTATHLNTTKHVGNFPGMYFMLGWESFDFTTRALAFQARTSIMNHPQDPAVFKFGVNADKTGTAFTLYAAGVPA